MTMEDVAKKTKKLLAAGGLAVGLMSYGLSGGIGTAVADGHMIPDPDGSTWGDPDGPESRGQSIQPAVDSYVTSSYPAQSSYPAGSGSPQNWPVASSYPQAPSRPGYGWGVDDRT